jgi:hypothetical protein
VTKKSKRFESSTWLARLMPVILVVLVLILLATIAITFLAVLGLTPEV